MNQKKIFIFIYLLFSAVFLAEKPGFPGIEMELFRIVPPVGQTLGNQKPIPDSWLKPLGKSDGSISTALRGVKVSIDVDQWTGKRMYNYMPGPAVWFWLDDSSWYDSFALSISEKDFLLSKKYQIRPGFPISQTLLDEVEHRTYLDPDGTLTLVFDVTTPKGGFATNLLNITIVNNLITTIYYGYSE